MPAPPGDLRSAGAIRPVHPNLLRIAGWISTVGAGVALNDLDGDGLPNDACPVDRGWTGCWCRPVPGTGDRYPAFTLDSRAAPPSRPARRWRPWAACPGDWNEDGRTDLLVYYWGRPPVALPAPGAAACRRPRLLSAGPARAGWPSAGTPTP